MTYAKEIGDIQLPEVPLFKKGKVRNVYDLEEKLLLVSSDRISAFDYILPSLIPLKGIILTQISLFWFDFLKDIIPNHLIAAEVDDYPEQLKKYKDILNKRSILVEKTKLIPIECVVRGYISGSGWKEYQKTSSICSIELPKGYEESCKLAEPIFTPSTKAEEGHDENINHKQTIDLVGKAIFDIIQEKSIALYSKAEALAKEKEIIIADTKFEFGINRNGKVILIDEASTPDSSRFWDQDQYRVGISPLSYDKQFVRNYLLSINWAQKPPVPELPQEIIEKTTDKYLTAYRKITGKELVL